MPVKNSEGISEQAADRLIAAHDGDVALLYIYIARRGGFDGETAARELCRTRREIDAAAEKLERLGLRAPSGAAPAPAPAAIPPEERLPEYTADEICRRTAADGAFACVADEAARVLGHVLGGADLRQLFGIYDHLGMPAEVLMMLLNYCADLAQASAKGDAVVRTSMNRIVKEAYVWANNEVLTYEQAEDYIRSRKERSAGLQRLRRLMGIDEHRMTKGEEGYLSSWLAMGFPEEAVDLAFERTVANTGALKWKYMDTILQSWHGRGLHSPQEIEEKDPMRGSQSAPARKAPAAGNDAGGFGELQKKLDKV